MRNILLLAITTSLSIGCAGIKIGPLDPKPKVKIENQDARLALSIGAGVPDRFKIEPQGGVRKVRVKGWHETLTRAFENGFAKAYTITPAEEEHDLMLVFVRADLRFLPSPGIVAEGPTPAKAELIYLVRVLDGDGGLVAAAAGEVTSKKTWTDPGQEIDVTMQVVKSMYKDIAFELVTKTSPESDEEEPADESEPASE